MKRVEELTLKLADDMISREEAAELGRLVAGGKALARQISLLDVEAALRGERRDLGSEEPTMDRIRTESAERARRIEEHVMEKVRPLSTPLTDKLRAEEKRKDKIIWFKRGFSHYVADVGDAP